MKEWIPVKKTGIPEASDKHYAVLVRDNLFDDEITHTLRFANIGIHPQTETVGWYFSDGSLIEGSSAVVTHYLVVSPLPELPY